MSVLFEDVEGLKSFRVLLASLSFDHARLVILFVSSLLRFRFCCVLRDLCLLCKKPWLWRHFLTCPKLGDATLRQRRELCANFELAVRSCDWASVLSHVRVNLLAWSDALPDVVFPRCTIDSLTC
jgi:hypothetical protein